MAPALLPHRLRRLAVGSSLCLALFAAEACGPRRSSGPPIGTSRYDEPGEYGLGGAASGGTASGAGGNGSGGRGSGGNASGGTGAADAPPDLAELERIRQEKAHAAEDAHAEALLAAAATPSDALGLVFVLGQRASDLTWTLAIENRGHEALELAADPALLSFELRPPAPAPGTEPAPVEAPSPAPAKKPATSNAKKPATPAPPRPIVCGPAQAPKSVAADAFVRLEPGERIVHGFDPRSLCPAASALQKGLWVHATYGFPIEVKKVWSKGKSSEVRELDKPPFVARRPGAEESTTPPRATTSADTKKTGKGAPAPEPATAEGEIVAPPPPLPKLLTAEPFELDETYPLEAVALLAQDEPGAALPGAVGDSAKPDGSDGGGAPDGSGGTRAGGAGTKPLEPPPLALSVSPLGTTTEIDETTVTFTVKNQSKKSVMLFLRRELVVYEILGPRGASSCRMYPAARAPDRSSFDTLGSGTSRSLVTRLAEACPPDTFTAPGTYAVNGRLEARDAGTEYGYTAFVGDVATERPARFVIRGKTGSAPAFRVTKKN